MTRLTPFDEVEYLPKTVLTVGSFDGVHIGHVSLINAVAEQARKDQGRSVILTFDPHPREILNPGQSGIRYLSTVEERCRALSEFGIDELVVIPFDRDFSLLSSTEFIEMVYKKVGIWHYVIGYDHQFGKDRSGSIDTLKNLALKLDFSVQVIEERQLQDQHVSSSVIRALLEKEGNVSKARQMLGRSYTLVGLVVHGEKRGRSIGFPTANLKLVHPKKMIPSKGVYAVNVQVENQWYAGMMNIGLKPTFGNTNEPTLEVHIFDFHQTIYGSVVEIEFVERIRKEKKFDSVQSLQEQLKADKNIALGFLNT